MHAHPPRFGHAHPHADDVARHGAVASVTAAAGDAFVHYRDRREAGRVLADWVEPVAGEEASVVALAGGGVPVAFEVAEALGAPLDVLVVHALTLPAFPGRRLGAIAEDGTIVLDSELVAQLDVPPHGLADVIERERSATARRAATCRGGEPPRSLAGRSVIVVDDGLDGGLAAETAVRAVRRRGAERVVVAVPIASSSTVRRLAAEADRVVAPVMPRAVGRRERWYRSFAPVSDAEVADLLRSAQRRQRA